MRRRTTLVVMVAALLTTVSGAPGAAELSAADRAKLTRYLTDTRDQVLAEASNLSDAQWTFKPGADRWSVGEVVEHLALAEPFIFELHQKTMAAPAPTPEQLTGAQGRDDFIMKAVPDRTKKAQAPEPIRPTSKPFADRAGVLAAFTERRAKTLDYASKTTADLRGRVMDSPLGPVDAYQWLLYIGAHTERHLAQIKEVKADPKFPKTGA